MDWTTDEFGNRFATYKGWFFKVWLHGGVFCEGPHGEDLEYDENTDTMLIRHEAPYEGSVGVQVPVFVFNTYIRLLKEQQAAKKEDNLVLEASRLARDSDINEYRHRERYVSAFSVKRYLPGGMQRDALDRLKRLAQRGIIIQLSSDEALAVGTYATLFRIP